MSSILDAVTKDAARSGSIPSASGGAPAHGPDTPDGGSGPSRFRSAILVVVLGVALGAAAARMFGGGEPEADDMLTDKATHREKAERGVEVAAATAEPAPKASKKDEAAHARLAAKRKEAAAAAAPPSAASAAPTAVPNTAATAAPTAAATPPAPQPLVIPAPAASAGAAPAETGEPSAVVEPPVVAPPVADPSAAVEPPVAVPPVESATPPPAVVANSPAPPAVVAGETAAPAAAPVAVPPVVPPPSVVAGTPTPPAAAAPASSPSVIAGVPAPPKAPAAVAPSPVVVATAPPVVASPSIEAGSPPATVEIPDGADEEGLPGEEASEAQPADNVLEKRPDGAPEVSILFVAWSRTPTDRMASMRVGSGSLSVVHEGEYVEGLQVSAIHPEAVEFQWTGQKFRVPVRPF